MSPPTDKTQKIASSGHASAVAPAMASTIPPENPEQMKDAVLTTSLDGVITSCNMGFTRYGYGPETLVGMKLAELFSVDDQSVLTKLVMPAVREKGRCEATLHGRTKRGVEFAFHLCLSLLREASSASHGYGCDCFGSDGNKVAIPRSRYRAFGNGRESHRSARSRRNGIPDYQPRDAQVYGVGRSRGRAHRDGAGSWRNGNGQGARRPHHPRVFLSSQEAVGRYQLRRSARTSRRERIVRLRERGVQRRGFLQTRIV